MVNYYYDNYYDYYDYYDYYGDYGNYYSFNTGYYEVYGTYRADKIVWRDYWQRNIKVKAEGGDDLVDFSQSDYTNNLNGGNGNDYISGDNGNDSILGGEGNDTLIGGGNNDTIEVAYFWHD